MSTGFHLLSQTAAQFYAEALALDGRAERCRAVARTLETRRAVLTERHRPVVELHREEIWKGRAASVSRQHLQRVTGLSLYYLGVDLAATIRALLDEAASLSMEAAVLRNRAGTAEAEASSVARTAATVEASSVERTAGTADAEARSVARTARSRSGPGWGGGS